MGAPKSRQQEADVNYEEVQMDMSEDSDSSNGMNNKKRSRHRSPSPRNRHDRDNRDRGRRDDHRREKETKYNRHRDDRYSSSRYSRDKNRDENRSRRRSPSHERRSRSPSRRNDYRNKKNDRKYDKKYEGAPKVNVAIEKNQIKSPQGYVKNEVVEKKVETEKDRFFMPGITGRFRDQIERRKLLWQKKDQNQEKPIPAASSSSSSSSTSTKVWQTTTFAQDTDGKVASKFKRLMGIKEQQADQGKNPGENVMKRQEEMFSSMEQQYEVARTATHTMRGVGLGFGSYQR
ncbi:uncharacterized protein ZC262.2 isoform X2 [Onthophagus taurus]|nr:uncharacterized protein ZC262.2 isoform X2 [Onthophagus taurus]